MGCRDLPVGLPLHPCNFNPPSCCSENVPCGKRNKQKKKPLEEKPHDVLPADSAGRCSVPGGRYPVAAASLRCPAWLFQDIPIRSFRPCTWSRTCRWPLTPLPPDAGSCGVFCFLRSPPGPFLFPSAQMQPEEISARWLSSGRVPAAVTGWGRHCGSLHPGTSPPWW